MFTDACDQDNRFDRREPYLFRVDEAAVLLGTGRSKVYELMSAGLIESVKIGRSRRIPAEAVRNFVEALRTEQRSSVDVATGSDQSEGVYETVRRVADSSPDDGRSLGRKG